MFVDGKVALITSAAGEIGAAIARQLADGGARVALADMNVDGLRDIASRIGKAASRHECDVSDTPSKANCKAPVRTTGCFRARATHQDLLGRLKDWCAVHTRYGRCAHNSCPPFSSPQPSTSSSIKQS